MQTAQQAFAIQKACAVTGLKDLSPLQAYKSWANRSSKTMSSRLHLLTVNQFVLVNNSVYPLHPTYALLGHERDTSDVGRATKG